ncbi:MAG: ABC transporter permease, partial [Candidatus Cloacimonetes bacterium]|nr:ABC transporter permease [Candidatus Cloacimonadota bacterium]
MFTEFFLFELKYQWKKISTRIFTGLMFIIGLLTVIASAGLFSGVTVSVGGANTEKLFLNSAYFTYMISTGMGQLFIFFIAAFMSDCIFRDYNYQTSHFFFTKPIKKSSYLLGRFFSNVTTAGIIFACFYIGLFTGSLFPGLDPSYFGEFKLINYIVPFFVSTVPNILIFSSILFALAVITKKSFPVYIATIIMLIGYSIASNTAQNLDHKMLVSLADPFSLITFFLDTEYWSIAEQNSRIFPNSGYLIYNRLLWGIISALLIIFSYRNFSFTQKRGRIKQLLTEDKSTVTEKVQIRSFAKDFSFLASLKQFFSFTKMEYKNIVLSPGFQIIVTAGMLITGVVIAQSNRLFQTDVKYLTRIVTNALTGGFGLTAIVIITVYIGELVWSSREKRTDLILDSMAVRDWVLFLPKVFSILLILISIYLMNMLIALGFQLFYGTPIEFSLYWKMMLIHLSDIFVYVGLSFFIHILINNKYLSHAVFIGLFMGIGFLSKIGIEHPLLRFNEGAYTHYSDMNGFGNSLEPWLWYKLYWTLFSFILLSLVYLIKVRGSDSNLLSRIRKAKHNLSLTFGIVSGVMVLGFIGSGSVIFYHTNILKEFVTKKTQLKRSADYEKVYSKYKKMPTPKYTNVYYEVDFYPEDYSADFSGKLTMQNKTSVAIDTLI